MADFLSNKNKEFIWDFLLENKLFNGIDPKFKSNIESDLNKVISHVSTIQNFTSLVDKNKEVLKLISHKLVNYRKNQLPQTQPLQQPPNQQSYKSDDLQSERQRQLEQQFKNKQEEMNKILLGKKPDDVKFKDEIDKPIGGDIDRLIEQTIEMRRQQLNQVLEKQDTTQAAKWIGNEGAIRNLKIGGETELKEAQIVKLDKTNTNESVDKKQVSFNSDQNRIIEYDNDSSSLSNFNTSKFLNKLKKTPSQQPQQQNISTEISESDIKNVKNDVLLDIINKKLDTILSQQREILEKLSKNTADDYLQETELDNFNELEN